MTVLGNIVAVTSIIAVVSLNQGLTSSVKQAILNQAGADSFNIQQFPITRSDEEFEKVRGNPRVTLDDLRAIRRYSTPDLVAAVMADSVGRGRITYRDKSIDNVQVRGVAQNLAPGRRQPLGVPRGEHERERVGDHFVSHHAEVPVLRQQEDA